MSIDIIRTNEIDKNNEKNSFIRTFKTDEDEADKNN